MKTDTKIWPAMLELVGCLEKEFADEGFCFIGVMHGQMAPADYGSDGMAWVRLSGVYPSTDFPSPDDSTGCISPLATDLEVGVLRCAPSPNAMSKTMPTESQQEEAARIATADMMAMRRAINCCFGKNGQVRFRDVLMGNYSPLGPMGGVTGGQWTLTISEGV